MEGRNLSYGGPDPTSKDGSAAKKLMLIMAKDLFSLYTALNNKDKLPPWVQHKLANSKKDLSDVTDYLLSKIAKACIEQNISEAALREKIKKSLLN